MLTDTVRVLAAIAAVFALAAAPASAAVSKDQGKCQGGSSKAVVAFFAAEAKALASCEDAIGRGELPLGTSCRSHASTQAALAAAATKLGDGVGAACTDALVAGLRRAGACEDAASAAALSTCLAATQSPATDGFLQHVYADDALPSGDAAASCREAVSKAARKTAQKTLGALHKCKNDASRGKLEAGRRCEDDAGYLAAVDKLRSKLESAIAGSCDGAALAAAAFGPECAAPASASALALCLTGGAKDLAASVAPSEYGDGGLCGDAHNSVEGRIDGLLAVMKLSEKVKMMSGSQGVFSSGWATPALPYLGIPGFMMIDGPRGVSQWSGNATAFPVGMARGATWDTGLENRVGEAIGAEARAKGASVLLAPVTAVVRQPRWGRSQESYGEDPLLLGEMGTAFVRGAQQHVIASVKHFAMNSIEDTRYTVSANADERTIREIYLPHFRKVVTEGKVGSVMSAYNRVNGQYCSENSHLLRDILKGEWGFRGFVESDWLEGVNSTAPAALAGLDIEMPGPEYFTYNLLSPLVADDTVPLPVIDEAVRRNLRAKFCFRLDTDPPVKDPSAIQTPAHIALAREAAEKGIVLLKNEGGALPLPSSPTPTIVVTGPLADVENIGDNGSSEVVPSYAVTALEGLVARIGGASVVHVSGDPNLPANAAAISAADAVVVVAGFTKTDEGENGFGAGDRDTYDLPATQQQLIHDIAALSSRTVVVLEGGSTIGVESWIDDVEALVMAWYPGMEGGTAIAGVLFGDVNPSGRLPLTMAKSEADLPPFVNDQPEVTYGYYHGYRLQDHDGTEPRYPFGYGLSYTSYAYSNLQLSSATLGEGDTLSVSFDVTNTGARAGEEVAQLYVSYPGSAIDRPVVDLRAFTRVSLEAGQTKNVTLDVPVKDLAWYDEALPGWAIEHIAYGVHVGRSSRDLPLSASFSVAP